MDETKTDKNKTDRTIPGLTDLSAYKKATLTKVNTKKTIILATNDVNNNSLFLNGLTQNIVILYDLFESIGYKSYLLQYNKQNNYLSKYDIITTSELLHNPIKIDTFIEIGMSISAESRAYLRSIGSKIVKL